MNSTKPSPKSQLKLWNSFIDQMPNQSESRGGRNGGGRGSQGRGITRCSGTNTNRSMAVVEEPSTPQGHNPEAGQTNAEVGPSERRPRVMIRGNQLYVGHTRVNPRILDHPLMAL